MSDNEYPNLALKAVENILLNIPSCITKTIDGGFQLIDFETVVYGNVSENTRHHLLNDFPADDDDLDPTDDRFEMVQIYAAYGKKETIVVSLNQSLKVRKMASRFIIEKRSFPSNFVPLYFNVPNAAALLNIALAVNVRYEEHARLHETSVFTIYGNTTRQDPAYAGKKTPKPVPVVSFFRIKEKDSGRDLAYRLIMGYNTTDHVMQFALIHKYNIEEGIIFNKMSQVLEFLQSMHDVQDPTVVSEKRDKKPSGKFEGHYSGDEDDESDD